MNKLLLKACRRCSGDLTLDGDDWICLQCGAYHYVGLYPPGETASLASFSHILQSGSGPDAGPRSIPDINRSAATGIRTVNTGQGVSEAGGQASVVRPWMSAVLR